MRPLRYARAGWSLALGFGVGLTGAKASRLRPLDLGPFGAAMDALGDARDTQIGALVAASGIAGLRAAMDAGSVTSEELTLHLLRRIRALEIARHLPRTPIIALTANVLGEDRDVCLGAGMDGFITKPLDRDRFAETLATISPIRPLAA